MENQDFINELHMAFRSEARTEELENLIPLEELKAFLNEGKSINWIASYYGCGWSTVRTRIYENPEILEEKE